MIQPLATSEFRFLCKELLKQHIFYTNIHFCIQVNSFLKVLTSSLLILLYTDREAAEQQRPVQKVSSCRSSGEQDHSQASSVWARMPGCSRLPQPSGFTCLLCRPPADTWLPAPSIHSTSNAEPPETRHRSVL